MAVTAGDEAKKIVNALWVETRELVILHWDAIKRTAAVLAVKDFVTPDELAIALAGSKK
jgi:hypothetical protein